MKLNIEQKGRYRIYNVFFDDLTDLYYYLKSNPKVNSDIFRKLESVENDHDFAGASYEKSIE